MEFMMKQKTRKRTSKSLSARLLKKGLSIKRKLKKINISTIYNRVTRFSLTHVMDFLALQVYYLTRRIMRRLLRKKGERFLTRQLLGQKISSFGLSMPTQILFHFVRQISLLSLRVHSHYFLKTLTPTFPPESDLKTTGSTKR